MRAGSLDVLVDAGEWDRALELAAGVGGQAEAAADTADLIQVRWVTARVLALRGELSTAAPLADWLVEAAREMGSAEEIVACLSPAAMTCAGLGMADRARELLGEIARTPHVTETPAFPPRLPEMVRTSVRLGDVELATRLAEGVRPIYPYHRHAARTAEALLSEARGDAEGAAALFEDAASRWAEFGVVPERGFAMVGLGRCLAASGRSEDGAAALRKARDIFAKLGARPALAEIDGLLADAPIT
jgi:hypothetical protein